MVHHGPLHCLPLASPDGLVSPTVSFLFCLGCCCADPFGLWFHTSFSRPVPDTFLHFTLSLRHAGAWDVNKVRYQDLHVDSSRRSRWGLEWVSSRGPVVVVPSILCLRPWMALGMSTRPCYCSGSSCLLQARAEISLGVRQKSYSTVVLHARMRLNLDGARNC